MTTELHISASSPTPSDNMTLVSALRSLDPGLAPQEALPGHRMDGGELMMVVVAVPSSSDKAQHVALNMHHRSATE